VDAGHEDHRSELVDVSQIGLSELRGLQDSALARALRRILEDADRTQGTIARWQSAI
jgi:FXSXX-COOH protein